MKIGILLVAASMSLPAMGQQPAAEEILRAARHVAALQEQDLGGHLIKNGVKTQVQLFLRKGNIQFQFYDGGKKAWVVFHMRLQQNRFDLFEIRGGKTIEFPPEKLKEAIMGTDLSYEDLALRFLYWPNGKVEGEDKIATRMCWKLRLQNPQPGVGRYALVYAWVEQKSGALMRVVGYDGGNPARALKQFEVQEFMKVGKTHTLKTMRVDSFNRAGKRVGYTHLKFDRPKEKGPGKLE
jgi:hypothetical protein